MLNTDEPQAAPVSTDGASVEVDVDRGPLVGVAIGLAMFFTFQAMILAAFQSGVISGDMPVFKPLKFAGITQGFYVMPSLLLFINRKCPRMAAGFAIVAVVVLIGSIIAVAVG